jgi:hypothetical protein
VRLVDDIDGSAAAETTSLGGRQVPIDTQHIVLERRVAA